MKIMIKKVTIQELRTYLINKLKQEKVIDFTLMKAIGQYSNLAK